MSTLQQRCLASYMRQTLAWPHHFTGMGGWDP